MEQKLKAEVREGTGKGVARKLRAQGRVPAVLYGHGIEPTALHVDSLELFRVLHTDAGMNVLIDLEVGGEPHLALARELQSDQVRSKLIHVDFLAISRDEKITVSVPVEIVGESRGVKEGGAVEHHLWEMELECLPGDVPGHIEADITDLGIGDSLRVTDIAVPDGVDVKDDPDEIVVSVVVPQLLKVEAELEEGEAVEGAEEGAEAAEGEAGEGEAAGGEGAPAAEGGSQESGES